MCFGSAGQAMVVKDNGQYLTTDSCKTFTSIPGACIVFSVMHSMSMTDGALHGYCVGGLDGVVRQSGVPEIIRAYTSTNAYCPGASIFVAYHAKGYYGGGTTFTAQLSDASGSFAAPDNIGAYTPASAAYQSGVITATLPFYAVGNNYRIRVVSTNPVITSPDNGYPITIGNSLQPTVTLQGNPQGTVCAGTTLVLNTSSFAGGLNPTYMDGERSAGCQYRSTSLPAICTTEMSMQASMVPTWLALAPPVVSNAFTVSITDLALSLANDTAVCQNSTLQLGGPAGYTYSWAPSTGLSNATIANPVATINTNIQYSLTITDTTGCTDSDSIAITARPLPQFGLGADTTVCEQDSIVLQGPTGYALQLATFYRLEQSICPISDGRYHRQHPVYPHSHRYCGLCRHGQHCDCRLLGRALQFGGRYDHLRSRCACAAGPSGLYLQLAARDGP
ncbi:MAG: hypothetical protein IPN95_17645 [Bacteroidetes bacterium]|nr:hypothetical protein [Bacteroidota bacterium]